MPTCAKVVQQPDGTLLLALDLAQPNLAACQYVVESGSGSAWRELGAMSLQDAQVLGLAVGLFWAIAWGFKTIGRVFALPPESE